MARFLRVLVRASVLFLPAATGFLPTGAAQEVEENENEKQDNSTAEAASPGGGDELVDECPDFIKKVKFDSWKLIIPYYHQADVYRDRIFGPKRVLDHDPTNAVEHAPGAEEEDAVSSEEPDGGPSSSPEVLAAKPTAPQTLEERIRYAIYLQNLAEASHFGLALFMLARVMEQHENYIWQVWGTVARASTAIPLTAGMKEEESFSRMCAPKFLLLLNLLIEKAFRDPREDLKAMTTLINWFDMLVAESGTVVMSNYKNAQDVFLMAAVLRATHRVLKVQFVLYEQYHGAEWFQANLLARNSGRLQDNPAAGSGNRPQASLANPVVKNALQAGNLTSFFVDSVLELVLHDSSHAHHPVYALDHTATRSHSLNWVKFLCSFPERFARMLLGVTEKTELRHDFVQSSLLGPSRTMGLVDESEREQALADEEFAQAPERRRRRRRHLDRVMERIGREMDVHLLVGGDGGSMGGGEARPQAQDERVAARREGEQEEEQGGEELGVTVKHVASTRSLDFWDSNGGGTTNIIFHPLYVLAMLIRAENEFGIFPVAVDRALSLLEWVFERKSDTGGSTAAMGGNMGEPLLVFEKRAADSPDHGKTSSVQNSASSLFVVTTEELEADVFEGSGRSSETKAHRVAPSPASRTGGGAQVEAHSPGDGGPSRLEMVEDELTKARNSANRDPPMCDPDLSSTTTTDTDTACRAPHSYREVRRQLRRMKSINEQALRAEYRGLWGYTYTALANAVKRGKQRLETALVLAARYWWPAKVQQFWEQAMRGKHNRLGTSGTSAAGNRDDADASSGSPHAHKYTLLNTGALCTSPVADAAEDLVNRYAGGDAEAAEDERAEWQNPRRRDAREDWDGLLRSLVEKLRTSRGPSADVEYSDAARKRVEEKQEEGQLRALLDRRPLPVLSAKHLATSAITQNAAVDHAESPRQRIASTNSHPIIRTATRTHFGSIFGVRENHRLWAAENPYDLWTDFADEFYLASPLFDYAEDHKDTVLERIFETIGTTKAPLFVEIGTGLGSECNSRYFRALRGWDAVTFDATAELDLIGLNAQLISPENINEVFERAILNREQALPTTSKRKTTTLDVLSIDVDSFDFHLLRSVLIKGKFLPRVIVVEHTASVTGAGGEQWFSRYFNSTKTSRVDKRRDGYGRGLYQYWKHYSASVSAFVALGQAFRYDLVYFCDTDLVFVHRDSHFEALELREEKPPGGGEAEAEALTENEQAVGEHHGQAPEQGEVRKNTRRKTKNVFGKGRTGVNGIAQVWQDENDPTVLWERYVSPAVPRRGDEHEKDVQLEKRAEEVRDKRRSFGGNRASQLPAIGSLSYDVRGAVGVRDGRRVRFLGINRPLRLCELYQKSTRSVARHRLYRADEHYCVPKFRDALGTTSKYSIEEIRQNYWPVAMSGGGGGVGEVAFTAEELRDPEIRI